MSCFKRGLSRRISKAEGSNAVNECGTESEESTVSWDFASETKTIKWTGERWSMWSFFYSFPVRLPCTAPRFQRRPSVLNLRLCVLSSLQDIIFRLSGSVLPSILIEVALTLGMSIM